MSVWFCIPSCRPAPEASACLAKWKAQGYKIALLRQGEPIEADILIPTGEYLGWARSTNILAREVLRRDPECDWVVGGGDDYWPDLNRWASHIATECDAYFNGGDDRYWQIQSTGMDLIRFGVMQPTGDRWGDSPSARITYGEERGAILDRIAGSPWMGREWCERAYLGNGPMWDGYHHLYADEELQEVAVKLGVFWQRRDLVQYHDHPGRTNAAAYHEGHLAAINTPESWAQHSAMFEDRKRKGFPGSEPCAR